MAKILGVGGIFFKSNDPMKLANWYQEALGLEIDPHFTGSVLMPKNMPAEGYTCWSPFEAKTDYFEPSKQPFMINFIVDDVIEALAQVKAQGGQVMEKTDDSDFGLFGWFIDPEGNKIELWQPKKGV